MNKKGQMSEMFKYIFGFVVGSFFLLFFIGFGYQYMDFSGSMSSAELVTVLDDDLTAFGVVYGGEKTIDYNQNLELTISEGRIISGGQTKSTDKIIFSERFMEGEQIGLATRELALPYSVGNVYYLDDGGTWYIVVYDSNTDDVFDELNFPNFMSVLEVDVNDLDLDSIEGVAGAYDRVRFVLFTSSNVNINMDFENYDVLEVTSIIDDEPYTYGSVDYGDDDVIYVGQEMLIGALLVDGADEYNYNLDVMFDKLSVVTGVYYEKSKFVSSRMPECDYNSIKTGLNNYKSYVGSTESASSYYSKIVNLEDLNKVLGGGCPEIF
jgi:hypothetical protein